MILNVDRLLSRLKGLPSSVSAEAMPAFDASAQAFLDYAREHIDSGVRSGRIYRRGGQDHQASAPGEFPKTWSGDMVASLFKRTVPLEIAVEAGSDSPHAKPLEYGTSRMEARPWAAPSLLAILPTVQNAVYAAYARAIAKAASGG